MNITYQTGKTTVIYDLEKLEGNYYQYIHDNPNVKVDADNISRTEESTHTTYRFGSFFKTSNCYAAVNH